MASAYRVFRKFTSKDLTQDLIDLLDKESIPYQIKDNSASVDLTFTGNMAQEVQVMIRQEDFAKANELLDQHAETILDQIDKNHYLFEFSNQELIEVLLKPDEWNELDVKLAQKILNDRGESVSESFLQGIRKQRIEDLAKPEKEQSTWILVGYFMAFLGGLFGMGIGYYLWRHQKTLPDGRKVYAYQEKDRRNGKLIFILGFICFVILSILRYHSANIFMNLGDFLY